MVWYVFSAVHIMLLPSQKPSSCSLLKFVYVISQLVVHPLLRKILDPPLLYENEQWHKRITSIFLLLCNIFDFTYEKHVRSSLSRRTTGTSKAKVEKLTSFNTRNIALLLWAANWYRLHYFNGRSSLLWSFSSKTLEVFAPFQDSTGFNGR